MAETIAVVNVAANHTFGILFSRVNDIIALLGNTAVTTFPTANGALTNGNAFVNGIFSATTLSAATIRGGNVQTNTDLTIIGLNNVSITTNTVVVSNNFTAVRSTVSNSTITNTLWGNLLTTPTIRGANSTANTDLAIQASNVNFSNTIVAPIASFGSGNAVANSLGVFGTKVGSGSNFINSTAIFLNGTAYTSISPATEIRFGANAIANTSKLAFIQGASTELNLSVNGTTGFTEIVIGVSANGGLGAVGVNTAVQYNNSGSFGATSAFAFNYTTNTLSVPNYSTTYSAMNSFKVTYDTVANNLLLDSYQITDYTSAEYVIFSSASTSNNNQMSKLLVLNSGTDVSYTEYGTVIANTLVHQCVANANSTHVRLYMNSPISNCVVRGHRTVIRNV